MHKPEKHTRVVAYARVSTDMQANEGISLDAQQARMRAYAEALGLEIVAMEVDAGFSAKNLDRPALRSALAALDAGRADALLVTKLDRLTRRVRDLGELIDKYFDQRFALLSLGDSIDTRSASGRLVLNVMASAAQWEREAISERIKEAKAHLRAQGVTFGHPPFGWEFSEERDKDGRLTVRKVDEQQKTIQRIVSLRRRCFTTAEIATELNKGGERAQRGGPFTAAAVAHILVRAKVRKPTRKQIVARRKREGIWWSTAEPRRITATDEAIELAVSLRQDGYRCDEIAVILQSEGHRPLNGRKFHRLSVGALLLSVNADHPTRRARERHRNDANIRGGVNPRFGFERSKVPDRFGRYPLGKNKDEQQIISRMVWLRRSGCSVQEVCTRLNTEGLRTRKGRPWTSGVVFRILGREAVRPIPGRVMIGRAPFGWEKASALDSEQQRGLRPVPSQIVTIKRAILMREKGVSLSQIAQRLNKQGRPGRAGHPWTVHSVNNVLRRVREHDPRKKLLALVTDQRASRSVKFGWRRGGHRDAKGCVAVLPHLDEQETLARAIQLREGGYSLSGIAQILTRERRRPRDGGKWSTATVSRLVRRSGVEPPVLISGRVPFGWETIDASQTGGEGGLRKVSSEQRTIRRAVALRHEGRSLQKIADTLEAEGRACKLGGRWTSAMVQKLLKRVENSLPDAG